MIKKAHRVVSMVIGEDDEDVGLGIRREERSAEEKGVKKSGDSHEAAPDSVRGDDNFSESQIHKVLTLLLSLLIFFQKWRPQQRSARDRGAHHGRHR